MAVLEAGSHTSQSADGGQPLCQDINTPEAIRATDSNCFEQFLLVQSKKAAWHANIIFW